MKFIREYKIKIGDITARQILDSRGSPTLEVDAFSGKNKNNKNNADYARASVPSGASTGSHEAVELRDKEQAYFGKGVLKAAENVKKINVKLKNRILDQQKIDNMMINLDNTYNKSCLGANAILGVSLACARLIAKENKIPLYKYISEISGIKQNKICLPVPFANVINGGKHATGRLKLQEFMIVPTGAKSFSQAAQMVAETYHSLKLLIEKKFGKTLVGDEGGFAPPVNDAFEAMELLEEAVNNAGYSSRMRFAIDAAASSFYNKEERKYILEREMSSDKLIDYYWSLLDSYPIISIEDPFAEDDFDGFTNMMGKIKSKKMRNIQLVGDDLLVSNRNRITLALEKEMCNTLVLKVNQIGTLTEAISAAKLAVNHSWNVIVSHRSGETEDSFIADFAVGLGCGQIKLGAPCRGERTAKYNQLLRIEEELGKKAVYGKLNF